MLYIITFESNDASILKTPGKMFVLFTEKVTWVEICSRNPNLSMRTFVTQSLRIRVDFWRLNRAFRCAIVIENFHFKKYMRQKFDYCWIESWIHFLRVCELTSVWRLRCLHSLLLLHTHTHTHTHTLLICFYLLWWYFFICKKVCFMVIWAVNSESKFCVAQSAGAVEYTDCTSAEEIRLPTNKCPDMTLNKLLVRFQWC